MQEASGSIIREKEERHGSIKKPAATITPLHEHKSEMKKISIRGMSPMQTSLKESVSCKGVGLHSGAEVEMRLCPAPAETGIVFVRTDLLEQQGSRAAEIHAKYDKVCQMTLCSTIGNSSGNSIGTVEHVMAALCGMGVDNAIIELTGPEVPIMDGSAEPFIKMINEAGMVALNKPRKILRICKHIKVTDGDKSCELLPENDFAFELIIDFENRHIGKQRFSLSLLKGGFMRYLGNARTFAFLKDVQAMWAAGLGLGGSLENAIVLDGDMVLNEEGLRSADEFVRHKTLDAVGDLYLAGMRVLGRYKGYKSGHALNNKLLYALFSEPDAFEIVTLDTSFHADKKHAAL